MSLELALRVNTSQKHRKAVAWGVDAEVTYLEGRNILPFSYFELHWGKVVVKFDHAPWIRNSTFINLLAFLEAVEYLRGELAFDILLFQQGQVHWNASKFCKLAQNCSGHPASTRRVPEKRGCSHELYESSYVRQRSAARSKAREERRDLKEPGEEDDPSPWQHVRPGQIIKRSSFTCSLDRQLVLGTSLASHIYMHVQINMI
jgi:hypothetical protein